MAIETEMGQKREAYDAATKFTNLSAEEQVKALQQEMQLLRAAYGLRLAGAWASGIMRVRMGSALHTMRMKHQKIALAKESFQTFNIQLTSPRSSNARWHFSLMRAQPALSRYPWHGSRTSRGIQRAGPRWQRGNRHPGGHRGREGPRDAVEEVHVADRVSSHIPRRSRWTQRCRMRFGAKHGD